jgi:hypothetical protein
MENLNLNDKINLIYDCIYNKNTSNCYIYDEIILGKININDIKINFDNNLEYKDTIFKYKFKYLNYDEDKYEIYYKLYTNNYPIFLKINFYNNNDIDKLNNYINNDNLFSYLLSLLVLKKKTNHILLPINNIDFKFEDFEFIIKNNDIIYKSIKNAIYNNNIINIGCFQLKEYFFKSNNLYDYLINNKCDFKILLFQIIHTLAVINNEFTNFSHNNLIQKNILLYLKNDNNYNIYNGFKNDYFYIYNSPFDIKIFNFNLASLPKYYNYNNNNNNNDLLTFINDIKNINNIDKNTTNFINYIINMKKNINYIDLLYDKYFHEFTIKKDIEVTNQYVTIFESDNLSTLGKQYNLFSYRFIKKYNKDIKLFRYKNKNKNGEQLIDKLMNHKGGNLLQDNEKNLIHQNSGEQQIMNHNYEKNLIHQNSGEQLKNNGDNEKHIMNYQNYEEQLMNHNYEKNLIHQNSGEQQIMNHNYEKNLIHQNSGEQQIMNHNYEKNLIHQDGGEQLKNNGDNEKHIMNYQNYEEQLMNHNYEKHLIHPDGGEHLKNNDEQLMNHNYEKHLIHPDGGEHLKNNEELLNNEEHLINYQNNKEHLMNYHNNEEQLMNNEKHLIHQDGGEQLINHQNNEHLINHQNNEEHLKNNEKQMNHQYGGEPFIDKSKFTNNIGRYNNTALISNDEKETFNKRKTEEPVKEPPVLLEQKIYDLSKNKEKPAQPPMFIPLYDEKGIVNEFASYNNFLNYVAPNNKVYNVQTINPLNHTTINKVYEDILPSSFSNLTACTIYERNELINYLRNNILDKVDGEEMTPNKSLLSHIKFLDLNPFCFNKNPYYDLPSKFLIYKVAYPIRYDEQTKNIFISKNAMAITARIYMLSYGDLSCGTLYNSINHDNFEVWREIKYYNWIKEKIFKNKISPNFISPILYKIDPASKIDWKEIENLKFSKTFKNKREQLNNHNALVNNISNIKKHHDLTLYSGKTLILLTEAPTSNIYKWTSKLYNANGSVKKMISTGYHSPDVWKSILFQLIYALAVLQKEKIYINKLSLQNNVFIKDIAYTPNSIGSWIYKINNINFYIPNYGYILVIDSKFTDIDIDTNLIQNSTIVNQFKIYGSLYSNNNNFDMDSIYSKIYNQFKDLINPDNFTQYLKIYGGSVCDESINIILRNIFNDQETDISKYLIIYFIEYIHNRIGTPLTTNEMTYVDIGTNNRKIGNIVPITIRAGYYEWGLIKEKDTTNHNNYIIITVNNNKYHEESRHQATIRLYPNEKIQQNIKNNILKYDESNIFETYDFDKLN